MLRRVARCLDGLEDEAAEVQRLAAGQRVVWMLQTCGPGSDHLCAASRQFATARDEVGVQVGLGAQGDPKAPPLGVGEIGPRITGGVQHQRPPVTEVDDVGAVAEPYVDQGGDTAHLSITPAAGGRPARKGWPKTS